MPPEGAGLDYRQMSSSSGASRLDFNEKVGDVHVIDAFEKIRGQKALDITELQSMEDYGRFIADLTDADKIVLYEVLSGVPGADKIPNKKAQDAANMVKSLARRVFGREFGEVPKGS